jgi:tRNA(Ile)-lysidine synthase
MVKKAVSMQQKVLSFIRENRLLKSGDKAVVAVSGGPDSVCLLHVLYGLQDELKINLHVAHLDHKLRGAASGADAAYVKGLARRLKIPAAIESAEVKAYQKEHRITLEEAAREVRYRFLAAVAQKTEADIILTGHTADDHAETILMHLIRGTGIKGLRGLRPATSQNVDGVKIKVVRPLLGITRKETAAYCGENRLEPRTDATNLSLKPFRNKIRHKLLPALHEYNPQIAEALRRAAYTAAADLDFIEQEARLVFPEVTKVERNVITLEKKAFTGLHAALQRQILRDSIEELLGTLKDIESGHIEDMMEALRKPAGKTIGLPFGLSFRTVYDKYVLAKGTVASCPLPTLGKEFTLKIPGETMSPGWKIKVSFISNSAAVKKATGFTACFDAEKAGKKITVRHLLSGDNFQPLGMKQPKKLNRFMMDEKIPRTWRQNIPLVCSGGEIFWVAGYRISEKYRVKPETEKVLKIEFWQKK